MPGPVGRFDSVYSEQSKIHSSLYKMVSHVIIYNYENNLDINQTDHGGYHGQIRYAVLVRNLMQSGCAILTPVEYDYCLVDVS